jgi:hypothetical protein
MSEREGRTHSEKPKSTEPYLHLISYSPRQRISLLLHLPHRTPYLEIPPPPLNVQLSRDESETVWLSRNDEFDSSSVQKSEMVDFFGKAST